MLYRQEDLNTYDPIQEAADILNESVYLTEEESIMNATTIPIIENSRLNKNIINFSDLEEFTEDHGIDYIDAIQAIAEANGIEFDDISVAMSEMQYLDNQDILYEMTDVVVTPTTSSEAISFFVDSAVQIAIDEEDYSFIENMDRYLLEEDLLLEILDTEEAREKFKAALHKKYSIRKGITSDDKVKKLTDEIDDLRTQIRLMIKYKNNPNEIKLREKLLAKKEKDLAKAQGIEEEPNTTKQGHSRALRRIADDENFGLTGDDNKEKRVNYRKMSRAVEKKRTNAYKRKLSREFEKEKEFYTSKETNPSFIKRTIAKITYSSPVQAIVKAVR